jgi:eukaryotic-like serine/threonine-protein kinase
MRPFRQLIHEIHRRSLWQVVSIYLAGGWLVYQIALNLTEGVGLPDWVPAFAFLLLLIGLPIVVATAFVQEGSSGPDRQQIASQEEFASHARIVDGAATAPRNHAARLLTWPRALLGGVLAFAALGAGTTGYMTMRMLGIGPAGSLVAAGVIDASDRIIIADFRSTSGDSVLAGVVTEAFRVDFARSTLVRTVGSTEVRDALERAGRSASIRVDTELARELAEREGIKAFVDGEVATVAGAYVLTARLVATSDGAVLSAHRESARDSSDLIPAIDRLSRSLRERTGESLREIRRGEPLEKVMTPSLAALRLFTDAARAHAFEGDARKAFTLLEEAVAIDSAFASAHRFLGVLWTNRGRLDRALEAIDLALRFPDRLTDRERYLAQASAHMARREYNQAVAAYEDLLARDPQDRTALNNIGYVYGALRDYDRAADFYSRAAQADTTSFFSRANLGESLVQAGRFDEAQAAFDEARIRAPGSPWPVVGYAVLPATYGDYSAAEAALRALRTDSTSSRAVMNSATYRLIANTRTLGRLWEARTLAEAAARANATGEQVERTLERERAVEDLLIHNRPERAAGLLQKIAPEADTLPPLTPALLGMARFSAEVGDVGRARALLDRYASPDQRAQPWISSEIYIIEGLIALAQDQPARAVQLFRRGWDRGCVSCEEPLVGRAFEAAAQPDSAIAAYERYLAQPSLDRLWEDQFQIAPLHERLGALYDQLGDRPRAAQHYARFVELWQNADPELQPRVQAAQSALVRLTAEPVGQAAADPTTPPSPHRATGTPSGAARS